MCAKFAVPCSASAFEIDIRENESLSATAFGFTVRFGRAVQTQHRTHAPRTGSLTAVYITIQYYSCVGACNPPHDTHVHTILLCFSYLSSTVHTTRRSLTAHEHDVQCSTATHPSSSSSLVAVLDLTQGLTRAAYYLTVGDVVSILLH